MIQEEIIEQANTEWDSSLLFAPKKDGLLRLCVDYRKLSAVTVMDSYNLQGMDKRIASLAEARFFLTLDASSGY